MTDNHTDGNQSDDEQFEKAREQLDRAEGELDEDPDAAAVRLNRAAELLAEISDVHESEQPGSFVLDEDALDQGVHEPLDDPPRRKIQVTGEDKGHFRRNDEIQVEFVQVSELFEPGPDVDNVASLTVESEIGTLNVWMSLEEWLEFQEGVDEVATYVEAAVEEELQQVREKAGLRRPPDEEEVAESDQEDEEVERP